MFVKMGLIFGFGLGYLVGVVEGVVIFYLELFGFLYVGVLGYNFNFVIGMFEGVWVVVFGGCVYYYENGNSVVMCLLFEVLCELGVDIVLVINVVGLLWVDMLMGLIMVLMDYINFSGLNLLIGE